MSENQIVVPGEQTQLAPVAEATAIAATGNVWQNEEQFNHMLRVATMLSKSSLVPQNYQGKPQDCFIATEMAARMNISPIFVMQNLYIVKGKPSWSGQACMAMIANNGKHCDVKPVYTGEIGTDNRGCYITATRISDGETVNGTEVTIQTAKREGWYNKPDKFGNETSKWPTMPEQMLAYRAAAFFARVHCPEALMGLHTDDEINDITVPRKNGAAELTTILKEGKNA